MTVVGDIVCARDGTYVSSSNSLGLNVGRVVGSLVVNAGFFVLSNGFGFLVGTREIGRSVGFSVDGKYDGFPTGEQVTTGISPFILPLCSPFFTFPFSAFFDCLCDLPSLPLGDSFPLPPLYLFFFDFFEFFSLSRK
jgi:hypothetical protein